MSIEVPDPTVFQDRIKQPFPQGEPAPYPGHLKQQRLQAFQAPSPRHVLEIRPGSMREGLQSSGHLKRTEGSSCRQHVNRARASVPSVFEGADNVGVVSTAGIAEHSNFPSKDVLKNSPTGPDFLGQSLRRKTAERFVRESVSADLEACGSQRSYLGVVERVISVVDRYVEGPADSLGVQEFGKLQIGAVAIIPARGYNSGLSVHEFSPGFLPKTPRGKAETIASEALAEKGDSLMRLRGLSSHTAMRRVLKARRKAREASESSLNFFGRDSQQTMFPDESDPKAPKPTKPQERNNQSLGQAHESASLIGIV